MPNFRLTLTWDGEDHEEEIQHMADDSDSGDTPATRYEIGENSLTLFYEDAEREEIEHIAEDCTKNGDDPADEYDIEEI